MAKLAFLTKIQTRAQQQGRQYATTITTLTSTTVILKLWAMAQLVGHEVIYLFMMGHRMQLEIHLFA